MAQPRVMNGDHEPSLIRRISVKVPSFAWVMDEAHLEAMSFDGVGNNTPANRRA